jgi:hypothetical protein
MYTITVDNVIAYRELLVKVGRVELGEIKKFVFHGYTFDFSNYNQASINVMKAMLDTLFNNSFIIGVAC